MRRILLTGFEPFAGDRTNPSGDAVRIVGERLSADDGLITAILPVEFGAAAKLLRTLIAEHSPDAVISTGLAGGRDAVTPERVAINLRDARLPDNAGAAPRDRPCVEGAPTAYFSSLPVKAIAREIAAHGIRSRVSLSAGTFVCNDVFFSATHLAHQTPGLRAGFIHVPWDTAHAPSGAPSLPLSEIATALQIAVDTTRTRETDLDREGGSLH